MQISKLILSIFISYSPAFISGFCHVDTKSWYAQLVKPSFSPPAYVFGIVWSILYFLIGISLYLFWQSEGNFSSKKIGFIIFGLQLLLNAAYTPVFFEKKSLLGGLIICILLSIFVLLTIIEFYKFSPISAYLLIPYLLWGFFAMILNYKILSLNS